MTNNTYIADGVYLVGESETRLKDGAWVSEDGGAYLVESQAKLALIPEPHPGDIAFTAGYKKMWQMDTDGTTWVEAAHSGGRGSSFSPDISNPQDGDTLVYDGTAGKWVNGAGSSGGGTFVIGMTYQNETFTLNKTYAEIKSAFVSGMKVLAKWPDTEFSEDEYGVVPSIFSDKGEETPRNVYVFQGTTLNQFVSLGDDDYPSCSFA